jgi:hypothetical protein
MPKAQGVDHPLFTRLSPTHYLIRDPNHSLTHTIHVAQIADFLNFDEQLRNQGLDKLQSIPVGFDDFVFFWNLRTPDDRKICRIYMADGGTEYQVDVFDTPVHIEDFLISLEQVGLATTAPALGGTSANESYEELRRELAVLRGQWPGYGITLGFNQGQNTRRGFDKGHHNRRGLEQRLERRIQPYAPGPTRSSDTRLSRLQFKGKRRFRSPTPDRQSPTPEPSNE